MLIPLTDVGQTLVSQMSLFLAQWAMPTCFSLLPRAGAAGNAGAQAGVGAHPQFCPCCQILPGTSAGTHAGMCRAPVLVQGCSGPRWPGLLVLLGCGGALPQGTQGELLQLLSTLLLPSGALHPKMLKIAPRGFHTADGELEIMCD